jgi:hypothetical protein
MGVRGVLGRSGGAPRTLIERCTRSIGARAGRLRNTGGAGLAGLTWPIMPEDIRPGALAYRQSMAIVRAA